MKQDSAKSKKQYLGAGSRDKPVCGTLSYLAECRGTSQRSSLTRWTEPPGDMKKNVRKHPT